MIFSSVIFPIESAPSESKVQNGDLPESVQYFIARLQNQDTEDALHMVKTPIKLWESIMWWKDDVLFLEFGRLANAFIPVSSWTKLSSDILVASGTYLTFNPQIPVLISLYDPFSSYTITTSEKLFSIKQLTNGSFYIGKESDGTISIYSVDAVGRITFLSNGEKMTDMVIFPWMYIRFDPTLNNTLRWVDLFRILLSMVPSGTKSDMSSVTWVEFVNLRMEDGNNRDTFYMYRLPRETRALFKMLHVLFHDRVNQVADLKKYASTNAYLTQDELSTWIKNPSKRNYFLFQELEQVLANALKNPNQIDKFSSHVERIYAEAENFQKWNTINTMLEQFLTDTRFALFSVTNNNKKYQEIYDEVAAILDIDKNEEKYFNFFQKLSDIYSQNIVTQKGDLTFSKIDTYTPTANELVRNLESSAIDSKDYFDLALYAYNVLKKAEEKNLFLKDATFSPATYQLLYVFFTATDKYANGVESGRKSDTYKSVSIHFYDHLLNVLVRSVYVHFTEVKWGYVYLKDGIVSDGKLKISSSIMENIKKLSNSLNRISNALGDVYENDPDIHIYANIYDAVLRFKWFAYLLNEKTYDEYELRPYKAVSVNDVMLPEILLDRTGLLQESPPLPQNTSSSQADYKDPNFAKIQKILSNASNLSILPDGDFYRINNASVTFLSSKNQTPQSYKLALVLSKDLSSYRDISISYEWYAIEIVYPNVQSIDNLKVLFDAIPKFITAIDETLARNPNLSWSSIRVFPDRAKMMIGNMPFSI